MLTFEEKWERFKEIEKNPLRELSTLYLSERLWYKISRDTRKALLKKHRKDFYVDRYVANIVNDLRLVGDTETLQVLEDALIEIASRCY